MIQKKFKQKYRQKKINKSKCRCYIKQQLDQHRPPGSIEVGLEEVVERAHVKLLGKQDMIGDVLHDLTHQSQSTLDPR